jgi:hypothetical protein
MSTDFNKKRLNDIGFILESGEEDLSMMAMETKRDFKLSDQEMEMLTPILMYKAADLASRDGRNNITEEDFKKLRILCAPHFVCWKSLLNNSDIRSLVVSPPDDVLLEGIGIRSISQLLTDSSTNITKRAIDHLRHTTPDIEIEPKEIALMEKRVELWKVQAELLSENATNQSMTISETVAQPRYKEPTKMYEVSEEQENTTGVRERVGRRTTSETDSEQKDTL